MAYSPFGYSAILAVFSEAARGRSREEIAEALHFPKNVEAVRLAYKHVLEEFVVCNFFKHVLLFPALSVCIFGGSITHYLHPRLFSFEH